MSCNDFWTRGWRAEDVEILIPIENWTDAKKVTRQAFDAVGDFCTVDGGGAMVFFIVINYF